MGLCKNRLLIDIIFLFLTISTIYGIAVKKVIDEVKEFPIQIQGYSPDISDDYVAFAVESPTGYITKFEPLAKAERVHHMILFGCASLPIKSNFWKGHSTCGLGKSSIIYAWARNAPSLDLPKDVAFAIGEVSTGVNYLVLQIHYADPFRGNVKDYSGLKLHVTQKTPQYLADVFLFAGGIPIPPRQPQFQENMSCIYSGKTTLHPFAFRVHTHKMGRVVSGYFKHNKKWTQIGRRNPQWPQLFQKITNDMEINKGDLLAATCRFDSSNEEEQVNIGHTGNDEMCNFYMMYYRDINEEDPFPLGSGCSRQDRYDEVLSEYPKDGMDLLPTNPQLEAIAAPNKVKFGVIEKAKVSFIDGRQLGQISGLAFTNQNNLVVFHRGSRVWDEYTFNYDNTLIDKTPIPESTIYVFSTLTNDFKVLRALGKNMFYMPHGIFIDESNYFYVTDVGSHQVHKMKIENNELKIIFSIGEKFVPGKDIEHLCKPSAVAVSKKDGSIYIADGYCNSRILKFSKDGKFLKQFGVEGKNGRESYAALGSFNLPHDVSIDDANDILYVTDRENGRVQVFNTEGSPIYDIKDDSLFNNVYSAHYCPEHGLILIPGVKTYEMNNIYAYVVPNNSTRIQYGFAPMNDVFRRTHIIRAQGDFVYVGEIARNQGKLWKFEIESDHLLKTTTISSEEITEYPTTEVSSITETVPKSSYSVLIIAFVSIGILIAGFFGYKTLKVRQRDSTTGMNFFDRQSFQPLKTTDDMSDSDDEIE
uniref:Peptidylglycine monooxygenase n=1 Tax=Strongyloides venezuelensis TaxID=75913 RepID=A0A0K0FFE0_STRVS